MTTDIPAGFTVIDLDEESSQPPNLANQSSQKIAITQTDNEYQTRRPAKGKAPKWLSWMDQALVRQVLVTDPLNCIRGRTASKWGEVSFALEALRPQPLSHTAESCRQRVKKLVEIYKVSWNSF